MSTRNISSGHGAPPLKISTSNPHATKTTPAPHSQVLTKHLAQALALAPWHHHLHCCTYPRPVRCAWSASAAICASAPHPPTHAHTRARADSPLGGGGDVTGWGGEGGSARLKPLHCLLHDHRYADGPYSDYYDSDSYNDTHPPTPPCPCESNTKVPNFDGNNTSHCSDNGASL